MNRKEQLISNINNTNNIYSSNVPSITSASLLVTENCNLRCTYCFEKHNNNYMSNEIAKRAIEYLYENAIKSKTNEVNVTFFGGEPTLAIDAIEQVFRTGIELQDKTGIQFNTSMITNCTNLPNYIYSVLDKYKNKAHFSVQLSIDGIEIVQNKYRITKDGSGSFKLIMNTLPKYKQLFADNTKALSIHGCINKFSLPYLYENYLFFKETLGIDRIWFLPIPESNWDADDIEIYKNENQKIYEYILNNVKNNNNISEIDNYAPMDRCLSNNKPNAPCGAGKNYATITANGDIYPCHQIYFNDEEKETLIGNIFDGVDDNKRRLFLEYDNNDISCGDCDHYSCYRCIAANLTHNGSLFIQTKGIYCKMMKIDQYFQNKLKEELNNMGLLNVNNCSCKKYSEKDCSNHTSEVINGMCDIVHTYPNNTKNQLNIGDSINKQISNNVWEKNGIRYEMQENDDGSSVIFDMPIINSESDQIIDIPDNNNQYELSQEELIDFISTTSEALNYIIKKINEISNKINKG